MNGNVSVVKEIANLIGGTVKAIKILATTALVLPAMALAAATADAAPKDPGHDVAAKSAACGKTAPDKDSGAWAAKARSAANQRSGSSTSCAALGVLQTSDRADYHCYTWGSGGYSWTYLRNDRTNVAGWVRDDLLKDGGSFVYCGF
jgi:hypothetical protein